MKAQKFIVVGKHESEQNSWIPNGDIRHFISGHRSCSAASESADVAHFNLGGFNGSNMLAEVMRKFAPLASKRADRYQEQNPVANTFEHAGWLYTDVSVWDRSEVVAINGGLALRHREP